MHPENEIKETPKQASCIRLSEGPSKKLKVKQSRLQQVKPVKLQFFSIWFKR